jgi:hypothetical protein
MEPTQREIDLSRYAQTELSKKYLLDQLMDYRVGIEVRVFNDAYWRGWRAARGVTQGEPQDVGARDEAGWLIEKRTLPPEWYTGEGWTQDSLMALRFARKQDADWFIAYFHVNQYSAPVEATGHEWVAKFATPPAAAQEAKNWTYEIVTHIHVFTKGKINRDDLPYGEIEKYVRAIQTEARRAAQPHGDVPIWTYCPECGGAEVVNKDALGRGYRQCKSCGQEWWTDIDYASVIRGHLAKRIQPHGDAEAKQWHEAYERALDDVAAVKSDAEGLREALEKAAKRLQTIALGPWRDDGLESIPNIRDYAHTGTIEARAALLSSPPGAKG